jgi:hypothetical protein
MTDSRLTDINIEYSNEVKEAAAAICEGMRAHDEQSYGTAAGNFATADRFLFRVDRPTSMKSATAYVDALFEKDRLEESDKDLDLFTTWKPVHDAFVRRSSVLGIGADYAKNNTLAWRFHKTGGPYWEYFIKAQRAVFHEVTGDYPPDDERSDAPHGYGAGPSLYLTAVDLHDEHTKEAWREAHEAMKLYFHHAERLRNND